MPEPLGLPNDQVCIVVPVWFEKPTVERFSVSMGGRAVKYRTEVFYSGLHRDSADLLVTELRKMGFRVRSIVQVRNLDPSWMLTARTEHLKKIQGQQFADAGDKGSTVAVESTYEADPANNQLEAKAILETRRKLFEHIAPETYFLVKGGAGYLSQGFQNCDISIFIRETKKRSKDINVLSTASLFWWYLSAMILPAYQRTTWEHEIHIRRDRDQKTLRYHAVHGLRVLFGLSVLPFSIVSNLLGWEAEDCYRNETGNCPWQRDHESLAKLLAPRLR